MTTTTMNPNVWAKTSREMVTQTRRWAETMRGATLGSMRGVAVNSEVMQETTAPVLDAIITTHDRWLDMWESSAHTAIDQTAKLAENMTPKV